MQQADLRGHLRWEELLDVRFREEKYFTFSIRRDSIPRGIQLNMAGAKIRIPDVYDRPLALIHGLIRGYWKGEPMTDHAH